jgi:Raf kinase inhibitor-like YbhB/YbcL family protein
MIPRKYTCDGENFSPSLAWSGVPPGTKSLALLMEDPDAPGKTWIHWVVYDIPPDLNMLSENVTSNIEFAGTASQGTNDFKVIGYGGPCPPSGSHRYFFKLFALDKTNLFDLPGASRDELLKQMQGHILAEAQLIGKYR